MSRPINEIEEEIAAAMQSGSNLEIDLSEGSVVRALVRSFAASQLSLEQKVDQVEKDSFLISATGESLDRKGYWLDRRKATRAKGHVVVENTSNQIVNLPNNSVIADPETNLLYRTNLPSNSSKSLAPKVKTAVPIEADQPGREYNLGSGTRLVATQFPELEIRVGSGETIDGKVCGSIQGGKEPETDESFRLRLIRSAQNRERTTSKEIEQKLLSRESIANVRVEPSGGGVLVVLVDPFSSFTEADQEAIANEIRSWVSPGVTVTVKQARRVSIDVEIIVSATPEIDQSQLSDYIRALVFDYSRNLEPNNIFNPSDLEESLKSIYEDLRVSIPKTSIEIASSDLIYPSRVNITYVTQL